MYNTKINVHSALATCTLVADIHVDIHVHVHVGM